MPRKVDAFWFGANNCEYYAFKGGMYIFEYPCWNFPDPPSKLIKSDKRIETKEDFMDALKKYNSEEIEYHQIK